MEHFYSKHQTIRSQLLELSLSRQCDTPCGLVNEANTDNPFGVRIRPGDVTSFPALNTLDLTIDVLDLAPGANVPVHTHPRGSEANLVIKGKVLFGFITTNNVLYSKVLNAGELSIIPIGLVHFVRNVGPEKAVVVAVFNSQSPRASVIPFNLFGSKAAIPNDLLAKNFLVDENVIASIKSKFEIQYLDSLAEDTLLSDSQMQELVGCKKDFERTKAARHIGILDVNFSEAEVLQAIQDLEHDKAPGPDGFPIIGSRGVRQGCLMSPLLFNIAMEGFSRYIDRAANSGLFNGFFMVENGSVVNHLHYADDTIFFVDNKKEELTNLFSILHCFEYIAGLKVNKSKTRLIAIGDVPPINVWATELGCAIDTFPFMYLGMPLGEKPKSKEIWVPIIEKYDTRFSIWNQISLTKGGKLALLKCILTSLPMYYFSLFKAPISVIKILEKKMRTFLWGNSSFSHLIKWEVVYADKERGGLGVLNLRFMNLALLAKWRWRFGIEKNSLCYNLIVEKYGCNFSQWVTGPVYFPHGVSCWKTISETSDLINNNSSMCVHSGARISFWYDKWVGTSSLENNINLLCKLDRLQFGTLADHITSDGAWRFDFKRVLNNSEVAQLAGLLNIIGSNPPTTDTLHDTKRWKHHTSGCFSVKTLYQTFISVDGVDNFPHQFIWMDGVPPKVSFLLWCVVHGKLISLDMLHRKGMDVYSFCILCGDSNESQDHLLLHCKVAYSTWMDVTPDKHWVWVFPETMFSLDHTWSRNSL
ncbi:uncharacterized protein LOC113352320 [Papaver somniferum]|uniref:uncharacterized protein LOC113352320 n=1 Tax=Papaver somniferum TaxID=3469 RepID=UPI000E6F9320|nr:uncharacterized protein LOC113352320 [Papaver somniferum]